MATLQKMPEQTVSEGAASNREDSPGCRAAGHRGHREPSVLPGSESSRSAAAADGGGAGDHLPLSGGNTARGTRRKHSYSCSCCCAGAGAVMHPCSMLHPSTSPCPSLFCC